MSAPRIIFVNRVYWPSQAATAQLLADLAEALVTRGWSVHVVAAGADPTTRHGVIVHRTGPGDTHGSLLSRALNYGRFLAGARRVLQERLQNGDIVVPMTDPPLLGAAIAGLTRERGARIVHWIQDIYPEIVPAHAGRWAALPLWPLRWLRNRSWRAADRCVPVSADMATTVARQGVSPAAISTVHNWAPRELLTPASPASVARVRQQWGLGDKFIVAYSGNLGRVHDFATVLGAATLLAGETDIVFLFIGQGAQMPAVVSAARQLSNVHFLPPTPREHLAAALAAADAHLVTLKPGFEKLVCPSKLAGILAAGRPALYVGPLDTEIARMLADGPCGCSIAPGHAADLAAAIRRLRDEPSTRVAISQQARRRYEEHFTLAGAVDSWVEGFRTLDRARRLETSIATSHGR